MLSWTFAGIWGFQSFFLCLAFQLLEAQLQLYGVSEQHIHAQQLQVCP